MQVPWSKKDNKKKERRMGGRRGGEIKKINTFPAVIGMQCLRLKKYTSGEPLWRLLFLETRGKNIDENEWVGGCDTGE